MSAEGARIKKNSLASFKLSLSPFCTWVGRKACLKKDTEIRQQQSEESFGSWRSRRSQPAEKLCMTENLIIKLFQGKTRYGRSIWISSNLSSPRKTVYVSVTIGTDQSRDTALNGRGPKEIVREKLFPASLCLTSGLKEPHVHCCRLSKGQFAERVWLELNIHNSKRTTSRVKNRRPACLQVERGGKSRHLRVIMAGPRSRGVSPVRMVLLTFDNPTWRINAN